MNRLTEQQEWADEFLFQALVLFEKANLVLPKEAAVSLYHHCGAEKIMETGAAFINVVNRDYCKSYIIMLKGQHYPDHYHKIKMESFYVLYGILDVELEGRRHLLRPGEMLHIERGQEHSFWTEAGAVFEEISTTYVPNDSFYLDKNIQNTKYAQRKTSIRMGEWKEFRKEWEK